MSSFGSGDISVDVTGMNTLCEELEAKIESFKGAIEAMDEAMVAIATSCWGTTLDTYHSTYATNRETITEIHEAMIKNTEALEEFVQTANTIGNQN